MERQPLWPSGYARRIVHPRRIPGFESRVQIFFFQKKTFARGRSFIVTIVADHIFNGKKDRLQANCFLEKKIPDGG